MTFYTREIIESEKGIAIEREQLSTGASAYNVIAFDSDRCEGRLGYIKVACISEEQAFELAKILRNTIGIVVSES